MSAYASESSTEITKLLVEVSRHGARASETFYPFTEDPASNFQVPYDLTLTGAKMHYKLGNEYVRQKYIVEKGFLSPEYNPNDIYV